MSGAGSSAAPPYDDDWECGECGYRYDALSRDALPRALVGIGDQFSQLLTEVPSETLQRHPVPGAWSPLEYACHVRDVLVVQCGRIRQALEEHAPRFDTMRPEQRVTEQAYNQQQPNRVANELVEAAQALAGRLEGLTDREWRRGGYYNWPADRLRTIEWIARHTVHEGRHHLLDVQRGRLAMPLVEAIFTQRAIRRFKPDPISLADVHLVIDAAVRAPNGGNQQVARFLVVNDPARIRDFGSLYHEAWWAKRRDEGFHNNEDLPRGFHAAARLADEMQDVPCVVLACAMGNGSADSVIPAVQNLMLAARALGIGSVPTTLHPTVMTRASTRCSTYHQTFASISACRSATRGAGSGPTLASRPLRQHSSIDGAAQFPGADVSVDALPSAPSKTSGAPGPQTSKLAALPDDARLNPWRGSARVDVAQEPSHRAARPPPSPVVLRTRSAIRLERRRIGRATLRTTQLRA